MKFSRKIMRAREQAENKRQEQEAKAREKEKGKPFVWVWAVMIYRCADCGFEIPMYLESTLERHNGENHKPVPFAMKCPECGGFHCYDDVSRFRPLPEERPLREGESYFKDTYKHDCGIPVIRDYRMIMASSNGGYSGK